MSVWLLARFNPPPFFILNMIFIWCLPSLRHLPGIQNHSQYQGMTAEQFLEKAETLPFAAMSSCMYTAVRDPPERRNAPYRLSSPCSSCNPPQGDSCNTSLKKKQAENVSLRSLYGNYYTPLCRDLPAADLPFSEAMSLVAAD